MVYQTCFHRQVQIFQIFFRGVFLNDVLGIDQLLGTRPMLISFLQQLVLKFSLHHSHLPMFF